MARKDSILKALQSQRAQDYTYAILFFIVSAFFAFAVIRPVLGIAISRSRTKQDLIRINKVYEENITKGLQLQTQIEDLRTRQKVLEDALPSKPLSQEIVIDLQRAATEVNVPINSIKVQPIIYKTPEEEQLDNVVIAAISMESSYSNIRAYLDAVKNQRRIKTIRAVSLSQSSNDDEVNLTVELESHYISRN